MPGEEDVPQASYLVDLEVCCAVVLRNAWIVEVLVLLSQDTGIGSRI